MTIDHNVKEIFKTASLHARAGIDSEKLTFDGLQLAVGNLVACESLVRFNQLYDQKHGGYLDNAIVTQSQAHLDRYMMRRHKTWNRYAMFVLHHYEREQHDLHHRAQENKLKRYQSPCHFAPEISHGHPATHKIHEFP